MDVRWSRFMIKGHDETNKERKRAIDSGHFLFCWLTNLGLVHFTSVCRNLSARSKLPDLAPGPGVSPCASGALVRESSGGSASSQGLCEEGIT